MKRINTVQKKMAIYKDDEWLTPQKCGLFIASKGGSSLYM